MKMTLTAKIQLKVSDSDKVLLNQTMSAYRHACNYVSYYIFDSHNLNQFSLHKILYANIRSMFNLKSQMAISVIRTVIAKYKSIKSNNNWSKINFKIPQFELVWNRDYSLTQNCFSINTLDGRLKLSYFSKNMEKYFDHNIYKFGTAILVYKHNKYFLHIPVSFEVNSCDNSQICNVVGIDRGINFIVATYDSKGKSTFISGKQIKQKRAHYSNLRQELQKRNTPSSKRRLKKIGQRENRWMQDVNHCVSKALVEMYPKNTLFVLEDLTGIRSVTEKVHLKYRYEIVSWAFYDLELKLKYKAQLAEDLVINVDPHYTSQCCPKCGHTEKSNRNKKLHIFCCKNCGYKSNDDRIGAMNLYHMGINYLIPDAVISK